MSLVDGSKMHCEIITLIYYERKALLASFNMMSKSEVPVDDQVISPRFSIRNLEETQQGVEHLTERGYAVFSDVLSSDEITHGVDLFWQHLEGLKQPCCIRRDDPTTWNKNWPGSPAIGLLNGQGIGQSDFLWYVRGKPNVKKVFASIWNSKELFTSFDGAGCFRNWHLNQQWKTTSGWYHCDQNPFRKPERCSVQGFVALTDNDSSTGGLVLVPYSHDGFVDLQFIVDEERIHGDFVPIPSELMERLRPCLIQCKAGDLVVWDSRTIHCNTPALADPPEDSSKELLRLVAYICMSPLSMFVPDEVRYDNLEEFRELREDFVRNRTSCTHWPLELMSSGRIPRADITPLTLNAYQHSLIVGTDVEPEDGTAEIVF